MCVCRVYANWEGVFSWPGRIFMWSGFIFNGSGVLWGSQRGPGVSGGASWGHPWGPGEYFQLARAYFQLAWGYFQWVWGGVGLQERAWGPVLGCPVGPAGAIQGSGRVFSVGLGVFSDGLGVFSVGLKFCGAPGEPRGAGRGYFQLAWAVFSQWAW